MKQLCVSMAVSALSVVLGACGGTDKGAPTPSTASTTTTAHALSPAAKSITDYGHEASPAVKQPIAALVKRYYAAAAADDGATACSLIYSTLSESVAEDYGQAPGPASLQGKTCTVVMSKLFRQVPGQPSAVLSTTEVTGVRVKGRNGFALLRSKTMPQGDISIERELGTWKMGSLIGGPLPGTQAAATPTTASKANTHSNYEDPGVPRVKDSKDGDHDLGSNDDEAILDYGNAASPADEKAIVGLLKRYYAATNAANGSAICSLIYDVIVEDIPEGYAQLPGLKGKRCSQIMTKVFAPKRKQTSRELRKLKVTRVRVEGPKGIALVYLGSHPERYFLVHRQGSAWKMQTMFTTGLP